MVAAWISALTGVGPAMASGSQTNSGICADLPVAPTKSKKVINVIVAGLEHVYMLLQFAEVQRPNSLAAELGDQQEDAQNKAEVADAVDDESFVAGDGIVVIVIPKADQQIGTKSDAFPADKQAAAGCRP